MKASFTQELCCKTKILFLNTTAGNSAFRAVTFSQKAINTSDGLTRTLTVFTV